MTTTLQRLDVVQVFTDHDGTGKTWNDYCTIKEQGDEDRAIRMVTLEPLTYRVFGRRIVDGAPVYACVFGYAEVSAEAMRQQKADKVMFNSPYYKTGGSYNPHCPPSRLDGTAIIPCSNTLFVNGGAA